MLALIGIMYISTTTHIDNSRQHKIQTPVAHTTCIRILNSEQQ